MKRMFGLALLVFASSACSDSNENKGEASCTVPAACGGTLDGTWQVDSMYIQGDMAADLNATSGLPAACGTQYQSVSVTGVIGTVTYANSTQTSNVTVTMSIEVLYTQACVTAQDGATATVNASTCASTQQSAVANGQYTNANCGYSSEGCRCTFTRQTTDTGALAYTISGNSIVFTNGDAPLDYCVSGTTLTYTQSKGTTPDVTTVAELHR